MTGSASSRVFITGGASGLGRALARQYLDAGWRVAIGDSDAQALAVALTDELTGARGFVCDVRRSVDLEQVRDALLADWGGIDLVYNNAGVAVAGLIEATDQSDWDWIVDINLLGVVRGCRVFVPLLRRQGCGQLVNVASMAGLISPAYMSAYCATKAAVVAISEVMQVELAGSGVGVSVVCPGFFRTGLADHSRTATPELQHAVAQLVAGSPISADVIASRVRAGVAAGHFLILTHAFERWIWRIKCLIPQRWFAALMIRRSPQRLAKASGTGPRQA